MAWILAFLAAVSTPVLEGGEQESASGAATDPVFRGGELYRLHCAACHGPAGEGVAGHFEHPIAGPTGRAELAAFIDQTMPEQDPSRVDGGDSAAIADYLLATFLKSGVANQGLPRIELAHLTVRQLENSVADIFGGMVGVESPDRSGGLSAEFRRTRNPGEGPPAISREEPGVRFEWAEGSDDAGLLGGEEMSAVWSGSIFAPDSGEYRFVVTSPNGFRLFINDDERPKLDVWVSTPESPEHLANVKLLGGRWYRFRMEYFRAKLDRECSIRLQWQLPGRTRSEIPPHWLSPERVEPVMVITTPFPADDSSAGYVRGSLVSGEWDRATTDAALEIAAFAHSNFGRMVGVRPDHPSATRRSREFAGRIAESAFRQPLDAGDQQLYIDRFFTEGTEPGLALKRSLTAVFKSPRLHFPGLPGNAGNGSQIRTRLGLFLVDSVADPALAAPFGGGDRHSAEEIRAAARMLLDSPAGKAKVTAFFHEWLQLEEAREMAKDPGAFAGFDGQLIDDLQTSLLHFVEESFWSEKSDFRQLFLASHVWCSDRMREYYGRSQADGASGDSGPDSASDRLAGPSGFAPLQLDGASRAGLLTHPLLLGHLAYYRNTSPIHRGVFVSRSLLGWKLNPPPVAVEPLEESLVPDLTTRERVELQTRPENCMSCHRIINPLGFALEAYDASGRHRELEGEKPVDSRTVHRTQDGREISLTGPRDLAMYLVQERDVHRHFVEISFHFLVKQPVAAYGEDRLDQLTDSFLANGCNMRDLFVEISTLAATHPPIPEGAEE